MYDKIPNAMQKKVCCENLLNLVFCYTFNEFN